MFRLCLAVFTFFWFAADAEAARFRWWGHFEIYAKSGTCPDYDPIGTRGFAWFRPELAGSDNGAGSKLIFRQDLWTKGYRIPTGLFTTAFKQAETIYIGDNWGPDDTAIAQVRFITQAPPTLATTTVSIIITGQIKNFDFMPGCVVTFRAQFSPKRN